MKHIRLFNESNGQSLVNIDLYRWDHNRQAPSTKITRRPIESEIDSISFDSGMFSQLIEDGSPTIVLCPFFKPLSGFPRGARIEHLLTDNGMFYCFEVQLGILEERVNMRDTKVIGVDKSSTIYTTDGDYIGLFSDVRSASIFKEYLTGVLDGSIKSSTGIFDEINPDREIQLPELIRDSLIESIPSCEMSHVERVIDGLKSIPIRNLYK